MLLFPSARGRKRAWLGFYFMTSHFFAGKAQRKNYPLPTPFARASVKHRSASDSSSTFASGKLHDQTNQMYSRVVQASAARLVNDNFFG